MIGFLIVIIIDGKMPVVFLSILSAETFLYKPQYEKQMKC